MPEPMRSIREVLASTVAKEDPSSTSSPETPTPKPEPDATPTPSREAEPEGLSAYDRRLVDDLETELARLSPDMRKVVEPLVAQFRKPYDRSFHKAMAEVAALKRSLESSRSQEPVSPTPKPEAPTKAIKGITKLIEQETDPAVKEQLRQTRSVLLEEYQDQAQDLIEQRVKPLEEKLSWLERTTQSERASALSAEIDALEDDMGYPTPLVEKHRAAMQEAGLRYPMLSMEEILWKVAPLSDLKPIVMKPHEESKPPGKTAKASVSHAKNAAEDIAPFKDKDGHLNLRRMLHGLVPKV